MRRVRGIRAIGVVAAALIVAAGAWWVGFAGAGEPSTYVEGARPSPADTRSGTQGCVPWSAEREDVSICGEVPEGYSPPPRPYFDRDICVAAAQWAEESRGVSVELDTCLIQETTASYWDVVFTSQGAGNIHVPFDPEGDSGVAAHP